MDPDDGEVSSFSRRPVHHLVWPRSTVVYVELETPDDLKLLVRIKSRLGCYTVRPAPREVAPTKPYFWETPPPNVPTTA